MWKLRSFIPILLIILVFSCNNDKTLLDENKMLKLKVDSLKNIIERTDLNFRFEEIKPRLILREEKISIGKETTIDLLIIANKLYNNKGNLFNQIYTAKSSNGNIIEIINYDNLIKYTPVNYGLDTISVEFYFYSNDSLEYFSMPARYVVDIKQK